MLIDLNEIKLHLRLDDEPCTDTDPELINMLDAAVEYCEKFVGFKISETNMTPSIRNAILLIIGDLYDNREGLAPNRGYYRDDLVERMLHFHRVGLGI